MSPRNSPTKLSILSKEILIRQIVQIIKNGKHFGCWHHFLHSNLPIQYLDEILNDVLSLPMINNYKNLALNDPEITHLRILDLLLSPFTKTLRFDLIPLESNEIVLNKINICSNITYLNMKSFLTENEDIINKFKQTLVNLDKLEYLNVGYIGSNDDEVIKCILKHCPLLRELNIKIKKCLHTCMLRLWPTHDHLRKLDLGDIIRPDIFILIVERFPKLEILKNSPLSGNAANAIMKRKDRNFKAEIISIRDLETSLDTLRNINKICPKIRALELFRPAAGIVNEFENFRNLQHFALDDFVCEDIENLLTKSKCGSQFRTVKLIYGHGTLRINAILNNCPNLTHLTVASMEKLEIDNHLKFDYPNLLELKIYQHLSVPDNFEILIHKLPSLESLDVENWRNLQDSHIRRFLNNYKILKSLKRIRLRAPLLTAQAFWMLVENCPLLEHIHDIYKWNISQIEIEYLITTLKIRNYKCCINMNCMGPIKRLVL